MKKVELAEAIGEISLDMVEDARRGGATEKRFPIRRLTALAAALVACLAVGVSALAASDYAPAYHLLYTISPAWAQRMKPIRASCVDNGILMEVLAARAQGNAAELLVGMKDLTGDRIDATMDLFDSYHVRSGFDAAATCDLVEYDGENGEAVLSILWEAKGGRVLSGDKVTFSVGCFLSGKREWSGELEGIDLARLPQDAPTTEIPGARYRGGDGEAVRVMRESGACRALTPENEPLMTPVPGVAITAAGYVDGQLHVQARFERVFETDNHGFVHLVREGGDQAMPAGGFDFWSEEGWEEGNAYCEYVFDLSPEQLDGCRLYGCFITCDRLVKGDWEVTFPLTEEE